MSKFFESKKEFTYNTGQKDHKVLVKMTEEGFTVYIDDLVRDLSSEICQIKDKLFTIPCMVNGITTQALCDSGAFCGIDVVSKTFLNKATLKLWRPYKGNCISLADKSSVMPREEVLLEIDISGGRKRHWFVILDKLSLDVSFGTPFLSKVGAVLDFNEGQIEFPQLINNETIRFPVIKGQDGTYTQAITSNPGEIEELKIIAQKRLDPRSISTVEVRLKGKALPDTDRYVKGILHLNSSLMIMPGLTHLRFDHVRQIYTGWIEIINIGNTSFSLKKGSTVAKHIYVIEEDAEQTMAKPLDKRPVGECFEELSKKLHQKGSDKGMF